MKRAIYPGSFDPVTYGHLDIIRRAAGMFDELIVGVLINKKKTPLFSVEERTDMIRELTADLPNVRVLSFEGLLIDFAKRENATFLVRGLRAVTDFDYELMMAQTNHVQMPEIDTVFFATDLKYSYLSSTIVREFASFQGDVSKFVPPLVEEALRKKCFTNS